MRTRYPSPDKITARRDARLARSAFVSSLAGAVRGALEQALAAEILHNLPAPGILATYAAMGDEIRPSAAVLLAAAAGWKIAFPRVAKAQPLTFHLAAPAELLPGVLGIPEPPASLPMVRPDVLLVPLLAADMRGNRLGQGGGYYDRTLALLRQQGPVLAIGLAWDVQIVEWLDTQSWDQPLDALATPTAFHAYAAGAKAGS